MKTIQLFPTLKSKRVIRAMFVCSLLATFSAHAQTQFGRNFEQKKPGEPLIRELNPLNQSFLESQRTKANNLVRIKLGRQLHQNEADLSVIQTAIDRGHLFDVDKITKQAFGAAMGDIFVDAHKNLNWKVYEDELGASHAVCLDDTQHCVFPMTILSRRLEAGLTPNVRKIFDDVLLSFKPYFPKLPYSREQ